MLRSVLPLGSAGHTRNPTETNSKLLELADRDLNEENISVGGTDQEPDIDDEAIPSALAISSVVTQVSLAEPVPRAPVYLEDRESKNSWKFKFRQVFFSSQTVNQCA